MLLELFRTDILVRTMVKLICAGLPKTGTKSMREALHILGYKMVSDCPVQFCELEGVMEGMEQGNLTDEVIRKNFDHLESFTDVPACVIADRLAKVYPEAKVVLMLRDQEEQWLRSIRLMIQENLSDPLTTLCTNPTIMLFFPKQFCPMLNKLPVAFRGCLGFFLSLDKPLKECNDEELLEIYHKHQQKMHAVCNPDRLLIYRASEGWPKLCAFLDKPIPSCDFPWKNKNHEVTQEIAKHGSYGHDGGYPAQIHAEVRNMLVFYGVLATTIAVCGLAYFFNSLNIND